MSNQANESVAKGTPHLYRLLVLAGVNGIVALLTFCWYPIEFYPDSSQYVRAAMALSRIPEGEYYYYRTIGYSLFLKLLGIPGTGRFDIVLIVQVLLGALCPLAMYGTLLNVRCRYAFALSMVISLTLSTYLFSAMIMTDQLALALMYMLIYLVSRAVAAGRLTYANVVLSGLIGFALVTIRPAATLIWICLYVPLGVLLRPWRVAVFRVALGLAIILVCSWQVQTWQQRLTDRWYKDRLTPEGLRHFEWAGMEGKLLFWQVYGVAPHLSQTGPIRPVNGKNTQDMLISLRTWGEKNPMGTNSYLKTTDPNVFLALLLDRPDFHKHSIMWLALDQEVGPVEANRLMRMAALEALWASPSACGLFVKYFLAFFVLGDLEYNYGYAKINYDLFDSEKVLSNFAWHSAYIDRSLPVCMSESVRGLSESRFFDLRVDLAIFVVLYSLKVAGVFLTALSLLAMKNRARFLGGPLVLSLIALLVYQAAVCSLFAAPCYRYWVPFLPALLMLAALALERWRHGESAHLPAGESSDSSPGALMPDCARAA